MAISDFSDLVPELICLGIDVAICGILYKVYTVNNGAIRAVKVCLCLLLFARACSSLLTGLFFRMLQSLIQSLQKT